ncbi:MAG: relaxase/mobilization nuclease domain-containing protein [Oscillospiraceae bacterium]|nr:relaxase/mobilization nuclease domain-containing protein [Oscillospiraceae bacterium]
MTVATTIIPLHAGKGKTARSALEHSAEYVQNPGKTNGGEWVTAYGCDPLTMTEEFLFTKSQYAAMTGRGNVRGDVVAYHLRQSFLPGETDAETANRIGYALAMKLTKGRNAFVCRTHVDKRHIHSHLIINSTNLDCAGKFRNFKGSSFAIRRISDHLCIENGLSIITEPKPSRGSCADWLGDKKLPTTRDKLRELIVEKLIVGRSFPDFLVALKQAGCSENPRGQRRGLCSMEQNF